MSFRNNLSFFINSPKYFHSSDIFSKWITFMCWKYHQCMVSIVTDKWDDLLLWTLSWYKYLELWTTQNYKSIARNLKGTRYLVPGFIISILPGSLLGTWVNYCWLFSTNTLVHSATNCNLYLKLNEIHCC